MAFVSYAQNFEDVMLWRALGRVERGFYIDVGAQSADLDSVTRAFSHAGWHGINIEPHPIYFEQLRERRPLDINLCCALGDHAGTVVMHLVGVSGLSTADPALAGRHAAQGHEITQMEVPMQTLDHVWDEHVPAGQAVHFLKVDVEGFELQVLRGNSWTRHRPWVVVVEATLPNSQIESFETWEPILQAAGYLFSYKDGLNRYYIDSEHVELRESFAYPPNIFDDFLPAPLVAARDRVGQLESELGEARVRGAELGDAQVRLQQKLASLEKRVSALQVLHTSTRKSLTESTEALAQVERRLKEAIDRVCVAEASSIEARRRGCEVTGAHEVEVLRLKRDVGERDRQLLDAERDIASARQRMAEVLSSSSWRATAPLRVAGKILPSAVRVMARRVLKLAWWAITPWKMPARIRHIKRGKLQAKVVAVRERRFNLNDDQSLGLLIELDPREFPWNGVDGEHVVDRDTAVRFVLGVLRGRPEVSRRFPQALSDPKGSGFESWMVSTESLFALSEVGRRCVRHVLGEDVSARARQMFLYRADVRRDLPHGLTPPGQAALLLWFVNHGRSELALSLEEIVWLFMQASERPMEELARAYQSTPEWQRNFPDGITVFGRRRFAEWFAATYDVEEPWIDSSSWPHFIAPAHQIRQAYLARAHWRERYPSATSDEHAALRLVFALRSGALDLSDDVREWCASLDELQMAKEISATGVNVLAHFCTPSGVRISAESVVEGLQINGIEVARRALRTDVADEPRYTCFRDAEDFDLTVIHTQPTPFFQDAYALCDLFERVPRAYRIAYWYWEFDSVPDSWVAQAAGIDEIWTATEFIARGLRKRFQIPVKTLFPGVHLPSFKIRERSHFGIDPNRFVFLFNFHMNSVMERKNPLGLIRAFKQAFAGNEPVELVLKTMYGHHHPAMLAELAEAAAGSNIRVIDEIYDASDVLALTNICDAYVSLHRCEGLGLTLAEAMLLGKPVIATNYSGNVDFMDESNSLLVPFELVRLGSPMPPYEEDFEWAEPSIDHAATMMRRLYDDPSFARALGEKAKRSAKERLSVEVAGQRFAQRITEIRAIRRPN